MTTLPISTEPIPLETDPHGVVRVRHSRVTLDTLVQAFSEGATAEEITQQYPTVSLGDTYSLIGYYLRRQAEVEAYLRGRTQQADAARQRNAARTDPVGIRARLLSRRTTRPA
jgi:uncharacterized protein (DUF433 family)